MCKTGAARNATAQDEKWKTNTNFDLIQSNHKYKDYEYKLP